MKKPTYLSLIAILIFIYSKSSAQQAYLLNKPLQEKVKSAILKLTLLQNGVDGLQSLYTQEVLLGQYGFGQSYRFEYNTNGKLTYEENHESFYHRTYNKFNELVESKRFSNATAMKPIMERQAFAYENGKITLESNYSYITGSECLLRNITFKYDKVGNLTQREQGFFDCNSSSIPRSTQKSELKYDSKGLVLQEIVYNSQGALNSTIEYKYDQQKRKISKSNLSHFSAYSSIEHYVYDKLGNVIETTTTDRMGLQKAKELKTYNSNNNLVEYKAYDAITGKTTQTIYVYNASGKLIEERKLIDNQISYSFRYDLDKMHNIKTATIYNNRNTPVLTYEIEYTYYP